MNGALHVERRGPLWLGEFEDGFGFVSYARLDGTSAEESAALVASAVAWFHERPHLDEMEIKTRTHDDAAGLDDALLAAGFVVGEMESVMVGPASGLIDAPAPEGVELRQAITEEEMFAAARMEDSVFESSMADRIVPELLRRQAEGDPVQLWAAHVEGKVVSAGRIDPIPGTAFAGIWGGATLPEYRGRGIYRALTAARVRAVMGSGVELVHSDSTEDSRPILERSGLHRITGTTPYVLSR